jgi:hypothetical protein
MGLVGHHGTIESLQFKMGNQESKRKILFPWPLGGGNSCLVIYFSRSLDSPRCDRTIQRANIEVSPYCFPAARAITAYTAPFARYSPNSAESRPVVRYWGPPQPSLPSCRSRPFSRGQGTRQAGRLLSLQPSPSALSSSHWSASGMGCVRKRFCVPLPILVV